jgi:hypothetical protein
MEAYKTKFSEVTEQIYTIKKLSDLIYELEMNGGMSHKQIIQILQNTLDPSPSEQEIASYFY